MSDSRIAGCIIATVLFVVFLFWLLIPSPKPKSTEPTRVTLPAPTPPAATPPAATYTRPSPPAAPQPRQQTAPPAQPPAEPTVYITNTGDCYHAGGCRYLDRSQVAVTLARAKQLGYRPCSVCDPPG